MTDITLYEFETHARADGTATVDRYRLDASGRWYEETVELTAEQYAAICAAIPDGDDDEPIG